MISDGCDYRTRRTGVRSDRRFSRALSRFSLSKAITFTRPTVLNQTDNLVPVCVGVD